MIFLTVGTHEQQFNRLVKAMDDLVANGSIAEPVFMQTGYSTLKPVHCAWSKFVPATDMTRYMREADVVVTHGGPSSFIEAMSVGKVPVVVPRYERFDEHVNDHQEAFVRQVSERKGGIVPVYDIASLANAIEEARILSASAIGFRSSNEEFCSELCQRIERL